MLARLAFVLAAIASANDAIDAGEITVHRDIVYAERMGSAATYTSLDLYAPDGAKECPIVVWIHGGGWRRGSKQLVGEKAAALCSRASILAGVNYRLHPKADFREQGHDIAAAVQWLVGHAEKYGGDPNRIILMGHSAGAHLAALTSCDNRYLKAAGVDASRIRGVILLDGAGYDVARQMQSAILPRLSNLYRDVFGDDPEQWRDASPISHVKEGGVYPPFLVLYVASRPDSRGQSIALAEKLRAADVPAEAIGYPGKTHATINREFGLPGDPPSDAAMKFIDEAFALSKH